MFKVTNTPETVEAVRRPLTMWQWLLPTAYPFKFSLSLEVNTDWTMLERCLNGDWIYAPTSESSKSITSRAEIYPDVMFPLPLVYALANKLLWPLPIRTHPWMQVFLFDDYYNSSSSACDFSLFLCYFLRFAWKWSRSAGPENFPSAFLYLALQEEKATLTAQWLTINASVTHCELATLGTGQWGVV